MLSLLSFDDPIPTELPPAPPPPEGELVELIGFAATSPIAAARSLLVLFPLLRFLLLMTSVLSEIGRGLPFILKKSAQALQRM